ncbi:Extra-large guanine nucleotide-binding protein like [Quillaja saponaria]|uniref:Extra-large guanine nucleotide-binding protein like n=1 Tax=Quillaja saponaria TaxID=32244 RepID=A0AAD7KQV0_QUISA|nr:Extra-large guanine nucleotide-binding protein like [Quillaja saponaria]
MILRMSPARTSETDDGVEYSFAVEYNGPPLTYDIPRAVPINVEKIPLAAVVAQVRLSNKFSLPVVQPLLTRDVRSVKFSNEIKTSASESTVSPTSVISFDHCNETSGDFSSKELGLCSGRTISSTSVITFEDRAAQNHGCEMSGELSSSGAFRIFKWLLRICFDRSERSSRVLRISNGGNESLDFNDLNQQDWPTTECVLSLDCPSSRLASIKAVDCNYEPSCDVKRAPVVTFRDVDPDDAVEVECGGDQPEARIVKRKPQTKGKKGSCYRCFKGNRFTEKEVCIVCDSKYCSNCVLRAMGSMPEENLFVTRNWLHCKTASNPPKKLKPENYWYDRVSGLWGKEGEKPSRIISPHLNVGGPIRVDASKGNTQVFINGREITKVELRMLQLAGVQCAGNPHFWVNEDGSYQEEGQKNTRGYIWGKAGTKLVCAFLSLPVPSKPSNLCGEQSSSLVSRTVPQYLEQRVPQKLLLVGYSGSGTSTIFKQTKILYRAIPFSEDERENIKLIIQSNVYGYLGILLEGRERFEDESLGDLQKKQSCGVLDPTANINNIDDKTIYSIGPRLKVFSDWLLKNMVSGNLDAIFPAATREYAPLIEELWNDTAFQATYKRKSELEMLPSVASYFLERAVEILRTDYEPSDLDILYAEGVTSSNGLASVDFSFPQSSTDDTVDTGDQHDSLTRYQLIRIHAKGIGENCKWLEMFEDVGIVIFSVALSDYDQFSPDGAGCTTNKMLLSRKFFESIVTHPTFDQMDFLLILNKFDLFEEKIEQVPLTQCDWFNDFHPIISRHRSIRSSNNINNSPSLGQLAFHYVAVKFKRLYSSLTGKKLYVCPVKGLEPDSVDAALKYAREILNWDEERPNFSLSDCLIYSAEVSSFSH